MKMMTTPSLLIIACVLVSYSVVNCGNYHYRHQQPVPNPYHRRQHPHQHRPHYYYRKPAIAHRPHHQLKPATINPIPIATPVTVPPPPPVVAAVQPRQRQSVVDVLVKNKDRYSTLIAAVQKVELVDILSNGGPFTIFAPTNDAFNALPEGALAKLMDTPDELKKVLLGHVSSGNYPVALIRSVDLSSLDGAIHCIVVTANGGVTVDEANVIGKELVADNGVIHTIDRVLLPQSKPQSIVDVLVKNSETYSTLITAVKTAQLVDTLSTGGPFTLFAPTNNAFASLPEGALTKLLASPEDLKTVLLGHVSSGSYPVALIRRGDLPSLNGVSNKIALSETGVIVGGVKVIGSELVADNGVIHTIEQVILHPKKQSIVDILVENSDTYSTLITAVKAVNLVDTLSTGGPFTLFAPTNVAFDALPEGALAKLLAAPEDLKKVLLGHVSSGNYPVGLIRSGDLTTLDEEPKQIAVSDQGVTIGTSNVIGKEFIADNGVIHTIDRVILPQSKSKPQQSIVDILIKNEAKYSTLITAVKAVELVDTLSTGGPFTLFAPTNDAFAALPEGALAKLLAAPVELKKVLLGHVVTGSLPVALVRSAGDLVTLSGSSSKVYASADSVKIDEANVVGNEFIADNGVIHTIDKVLLPSAPNKRQSIVDILIENSDTYSTLITATKAADLVETLSNGGPFTLFAPTNSAFASLPEGSLAKLLASPEDLKKVLLGHVSSGNYPVALIRSGDSSTLNGGKITLNVTNDGVTVGDAKVIGKEFIADNGVINTIDKVLLLS